MAHFNKLATMAVLVWLHMVINVVNIGVYTKNRDRDRNRDRETWTERQRQSIEKVIKARKMETERKR